MGFLVQVSDVAAFALSGAAAYFIYFGELIVYSHKALTLLWIFASLMMTLMSSLIYRAWRGGQLIAMLGRVCLAWLLTWFAVLSWAYLIGSTEEYPREWLEMWAFFSLAFSWIGRIGLYFLMNWMQGSRVNEMRVLLVGSGKTVQDIRRRVKASAWTGYRVVGVTPGESSRALEEAFIKVRPDEVWICQQPGDIRVAENVLHTLRHSTANIRLIPDLTLIQLVNHGISIVVGVPMLDISSTPMEGGNELVKWLEDKLLAFCILFLILPLMLIIALAVKITSPGPVIFRQKRLGWNNEPIYVYKFRSMYVHQPTDQLKQAAKGDSRITPLGRILRSTSLDELPQFINVLQGNMSVVGPRPHAVEHNGQYKELIPKYMLRHKVKPGITGWAQINGLRGETDTVDKMEARVRADIYYIEHWSLWFDLKIVFLTVFKGFIGANAY